MEKKNDTTELVFILDRSGSMAGLEGDTIGGFNAMLARQKQENAGRCYVSTVLFAGESAVLHDRLPLEQVPPMTAKDYCVGGCTALLDALGGAIRHVENIHKYARPEDVPARTMFVVTTDGMENASRRFGSDEVKRMVSAHREQGWEFLFVAANIDAVEAAAGVGIGRDRAVNYRADARGTGVVYEALGKAVSSVRKCAKVEANWSAEIAEDFENRR